MLSGDRNRHSVAAISLLSDLLEDSGLQIRISEDLPARPIGRDAVYNVAVLLLAMKGLGRASDEWPEWLVANYHICSFLHFACRRPRVIDAFENWSVHRYRKHAANLLEWPALPRGFLVDQVFGRTCILLATLGEARVLTRNLMIACQKDSMFERWIAMIETLNLFGAERDALEKLASIGLTQTKLGVA